MEHMVSISFTSFEDITKPLDWTPPLFLSKSSQVPPELIIPTLESSPLPPESLEWHIEELNMHIIALSLLQDTCCTHGHQKGILAHWDRLTIGKGFYDTSQALVTSLGWNNGHYFTFRPHLGYGLCTTDLQESFPFIPPSNSLPINTELL